MLCFFGLLKSQHKINEIKKKKNLNKISPRVFDKKGYFFISYSSSKLILVFLKGGAVESADHCSALEGIFSRTCVVNEMSDFTELVLQPEKIVIRAFQTLLSPLIRTEINYN